MSITAIPAFSAYRLGNRYVAARLRVPAPPVGTQQDKSLHLAFLLDTSGSMEGDRLSSVKRTLASARDLFSPTDRVTLVCFDDMATTVAAGLLMDDSGTHRFYNRVERITTQGCTNLSAGIEKLLTEQSADRPYTALVILTDGHINRGVTLNAGLQTMIAGLGGHIPVTTLGYGAEHNRTLLRDIALRSRGAYTFVDSDETLPVVMGDLMAGQRSTVLRRATVSIEGQPNWTSAELDGNRSQHLVGDIVPDRDYWIVFENADEPAHADLQLTLTAATELPGAIEANIEEPPAELVPEVTAQVFRCRVAGVSAAVTNALEQNMRPEEAYRVRLTRLQDELDAAEISPLILRLRAQVTELLAAIDAVPVTPAPSSQNVWGVAAPSPGGFGTSTPTAMLARLASNTAQLSLQRGVASASASASIDPASASDPIASANMFSSPVQRLASNTCRTNYNRSSSPHTSSPHTSSPHTPPPSS
jgi:hypothetical protein